MREVLRWSLLFACSMLLCFIVATAASAEPFKMTSSTQFLWGVDDLDRSQAILAQYLRLSYNPENSKIALAGYGRLTDAFDSGAIRENGLQGRLYYLYLDVVLPIENTSLRLGRQYVNFSAGSSLMDGATLSVHKLGPVGITLAGGRDVVFSLDSEQSRLGNYFVGVDVHLEGIKATQLGISYVRKYDDWYVAREEFGLNFRYSYRYLSPYAEVRYDRLSKVFDEATVGVDIFPMSNLMIKGEFYQSFPTFDSTSIYSVFAVDQYREYLVRAEYSFDNVPLTPFASYARQTYEGSETANNFIVGTKILPMKNLTVNASFDRRDGYGGKTWGFEVTADYKINKKFLLAAGVQYDAYMRPDQDGNSYARRYWAGGQWILNKNLSLVARIEDDVNESFNNRTLGRVSLNWNL
ncbi:MAG TPA: hypothetical protein VFG09_08875 [Thermodesulfovibrionales bacterium]|nr:hypothetical protein [Thermodesulfovibrionales bacterium]